MFTVLIAEPPRQDSGNVFQMLNNHFSSECLLLRVDNLKEAKRFIETDTIDIFWLDTELSGQEIPRIFNALQVNNPNCAVLLLGQGDQMENHYISDEEAVVDYLLRPFSNLELVLTMEEALQKCRSGKLRQDELSPDTTQGELTRTDVIRHRIQQYIVNHYNEIISMQDVAKAMNYSETHFCRLFKQCFHVNFSVYLNEYKVKQAKKMLLGTNQTVKEVGISCGFRDTSYFIRVFKRFTGMTPSDYRIYKLTMTAKKYNNS